ncbi:Thioredoxin domain-containing protein [Aphelenchoides fujianensis]|nr:Thioredoxin domain-containing protein [Aphelenchoides fujianensis]
MPSIRRLVAAGLLLLPLLQLAAATGAISLTNANLETTLRSAQWCPFSRRLKPIFEQAAEKWHEDHPSSSVVWAIVDSVANADVADKYFVNKYPTMKVFINGELISKEYRSTRSVEALTEFVKQQLQVSINEFSSAASLDATMDKSKRNVIAYYRTRDGPEYQAFQKAAALLREDCAFWTATGEALQSTHENTLIFRDPNTNGEQKFSGNFADYEFVKQWLHDKCIPVVREVTFENVEELTEEGNPFLIFFRDPANKEDDKFFTELLHDQRGGVNALLADGHKFAHPLKHLGKTAKDLPHMFLFPDMKTLGEPGKLRHSIGRWTSEWLNSRSSPSSSWSRTTARRDRRPPSRPQDTTPKSSIFKELKPSEKRYSLLMKTEL